MRIASTHSLGKIEDWQIVRIRLEKTQKSEHIENMFAFLCLSGPAVAPGFLSPVSFPRHTVQRTFTLLSFLIASFLHMEQSCVLQALDFL
jgi:hypothetical protein